MRVPVEFQRLVHSFHPDVFQFAASEREVVASALRGLKKPEQAAVKRFLSDLLIEANGADLRRIWNSARPELSFRKSSDLRAFLTVIREMADGEADAPPGGRPGTRKHHKGAG